jgi:hypothetical protein
VRFLPGAPLRDADLKSLTPKDRIKAITDLCKFTSAYIEASRCRVSSTDLTFLDQFTETQLQILLENS